MSENTFPLNDTSSRHSSAEPTFLSTLHSWVRRRLGAAALRSTAPIRAGDTLFLDTETTGLHGHIGIVEIAIVDQDGNVLIDTLVNPEMPIPAQATAIHHITDADVVGAPALAEIMPRVNQIIRGKRVVIFNRSYDQRLFPCRLNQARSVHCAMLRFGQLSIASGRGNGTLASAAAWAGHVWTGSPHRALADSLAAASVWRSLDAAQIPLRDTRGNL